MRLLCVILALSLSACADGRPEYCSTAASTYGVEWPDGQVRKSVISRCESGYHVQSIDGETFSADRVRIRVIDAFGQPQIVDY